MLQDLQMVELKSEEKLWKMSVVMTSFSNDEGARPPTLHKNKVNWSSRQISEQLF